MTRGRAMAAVLLIVAATAPGSAAYDAGADAISQFDANWFLRAAARAGRSCDFDWFAENISQGATLIYDIRGYPSRKASYTRDVYLQKLRQYCAEAKWRGTINLRDTSAEISGYSTTVTMPMTKNSEVPFPGSLGFTSGAPESAGWTLKLKTEQGIPKLYRYHQTEVRRKPGRAPWTGD